MSESRARACNHLDFQGESLAAIVAPGTYLLYDFGALFGGVPLARFDPKMVFCTEDSDSNQRFVIRPNRSLTWRQTKAVFAVLTAICLGIAGAFAWQGFWPVLPFAGLEVLALGAGLYVCALRGRETEVVSISQDRVEVEKRRPRALRTWVFQRAWAQIRLSRSRVRWYPSRLVLHSHGKQVQLGDFLNEEERQELAGALRRAIEASD